jgi:hypothetical protein
MHAVVVAADFTEALSACVCLYLCTSWGDYPPDGEEEESCARKIRTLSLLTPTHTHTNTRGNTNMHIHFNKNH